MNDIRLRLGNQLPIDQLLSLSDSVGWTDYTIDQNGAMLKTAVHNSAYVVTAWKVDELIGLARGMSDDVSIFYLQHILVRPEYQGTGIGHLLLNNFLDRFKHVRTKLLLTDNDEQRLKFYESMGFKNTRHLAKVTLNAFVQFNELD